MFFKSITNNHFLSKGLLIITLITTSLSACVSNNSTRHTHKPSQATYPNTTQQTPYFQSSYICAQANQYIGQVIGDGQCVSLIKKCSPAPQTSLWLPGKKVLSLAQNTIKPGSIIATFKNGKYPNKAGYHAAIYIKHDENGIWVWDQWIGKPVHKRLIRTRYDKAAASNTAQAYYLVQ